MKMPLAAATCSLAANEIERLRAELHSQTSQFDSPSDAAADYDKALDRYIAENDHLRAELAAANKMPESYLLTRLIKYFSIYRDRNYDCDHEVGCCSCLERGLLKELEALATMIAAESEPAATQGCAGDEPVTASPPTPIPQR